MTTSQLAYAGFRAARARLSAAARPRQEDTIVGALESVYWAGRLDTCLRAADPDYDNLAGAGADLMLAVRWLRHRTEHRLPLEDEGDGDLRWVAGAELTPGPAALLVLFGSDAYEDQMAGRPATLVIDEIASWFFAEQRRSGSLIAPVK